MFARFVEASIIARNLAVAALAANASYTVYSANYYGNTVMTNATPVINGLSLELMKEINGKK
jgi:hypothetical protein